MAGKKQYFDHRYLFMRGLLVHERMARGRHYMKSAAECTSKAIVSLELADKNVNTIKQAVKLEAIGPEMLRRLEGYVTSNKYSRDPPAPGRFVSSAGALLVALLNLTEQAAGTDNDREDGVALIAEDDLRQEAALLCEEKFLGKDDPGFCPAWWRLEVLIKRDLIKRRSLHKSNVYQLLPAGRQVAEQLHLRSHGAQAVAKPTPRKRKTESDGTPSVRKKKIKTSELPAAASSSTCTTSTASCNSNVMDAMYSNDTGHDGVILLVDTQECGGDRGGLGELCEMIEQTGVVYKTRKLPVGDYAWMWRADGRERQLPLLLERKRADDVACSLKDGRFWGQINKMVAWKKEFVSKEVPADLQYIVEGQPEKFVAQCMDGCQGVGRCGNPTLEQVKRVLLDLDRHPELQLLRKESILDTVRHLHKTTCHLKNRTQRGEFDLLVVAELQADSLHKAEHVIHDVHSMLKTEKPTITKTKQPQKDDTTDSWSQECILVKEELTVPMPTTTNPARYGRFPETKGIKADDTEQNVGRRSSNCISLLEDCEDELPPLHLPPLCGPRKRARVEDDDAVPVILTDTRPSVDLTKNGGVHGSPSHGRVYQMKRTKVLPVTTSPHKPTLPPPTGTTATRSGSDCDKRSTTTTAKRLENKGSVVDKCDRNTTTFPASSASFSDETFTHCSVVGKKSCVGLGTRSHDQGVGGDGCEAGVGVELEIPGVKCSARMENSIPGHQGQGREAWDVDQSDSDSLPDLDLSGLAGERGLTMSTESLPSPPYPQTWHAEWGRRGDSTHDCPEQETERKRAAGLPAESSLNDAMHSADKIVQIAAVFPQLKAHDITAILRRCGGCVERTVTALLEDPALLSGTTTTTTTATASTSSSTPATHIIDLTE